MVSLVNAVLFGAVLVVHTAIAAVITRFLRLRLKTQWGPVVYAALLIPVVLVVTTLVFSGILGIGFDLGSPGAVIGLMVGMPLVIGFAIDVLYMPSPDEYELPDTRRS
jgi:hypothetical protein